MTLKHNLKTVNQIVETAISDRATGKIDEVATLENIHLEISKAKLELEQRQSFYKLQFPKNQKHIPTNPAKAYFFGKHQANHEVLGQ